MNQCLDQCLKQCRYQRLKWLLKSREEGRASSRKTEPHPTSIRAVRLLCMRVARNKRLPQSSRGSRRRGDAVKCCRTSAPASTSGGSGTLTVGVVLMRKTARLTTALKKIEFRARGAIECMIGLTNAKSAKQFYAPSAPSTKHANNAT